MRLGSGDEDDARIREGAVVSADVEEVLAQDEKRARPLKLAPRLLSERKR
jgi:hypothetical protein